MQTSFGRMFRGEESVKNTVTDVVGQVGQIGVSQYSPFAAFPYTRRSRLADPHFRRRRQQRPPYPEEELTAHAESRISDHKILSHANTLPTGSQRKTLARLFSFHVTTKQFSNNFSSCYLLRAVWRYVFFPALSRRRDASLAVTRSVPSQRVR